MSEGTVAPPPALGRPRLRFRLLKLTADRRGEARCRGSKKLLAEGVRFCFGFGRVAVAAIDTLDSSGVGVGAAVATFATSLADTTTAGGGVVCLGVGKSILYMYVTLFLRY